MDVRLGASILALLVLVGGCEIEVDGRTDSQTDDGKPAFTPLFPPPALETRTFPLEHLALTQATALIDPYVYRDRPGAPGTISGDAGAISVRETPDNLDKIARMLEQFDAAAGAPSYRLHFQVVTANGGGSTDERVAPVENELRKLFRFEGYSLIGEGHVAVSNGPFELQIETDAAEPMEPSQNWRIHIDGSIHRGRELRLSITDLPPGFGTTARRTGKVETRLGFRTGQTLVLGSMPSQDQTVFIVVHVSDEGEPT